MEIVTLNVWGGKLFSPLIKLIQDKSFDVDVFCFQDVLFGSQPGFSPIQKGRINLFSEIEKVLPDFKPIVFRDSSESYFHGEYLPLDVGVGQAIFVRKSLEIVDSGGFRSHEDSSYTNGGDMVSGRCQWVKVNSPNSGNVAVLNFHGLWQRGTNKIDTPERLEQSEKVNSFIKSINGKKVLCGDFNMIPEGKAMGIQEEDMTNLIKKYNVTSTRNSHYSKPEKFADYVLVSTNVSVKDFKVLPNEVSDHMALLLSFD